MNEILFDREGPQTAEPGFAGEAAGSGAEAGATAASVVYQRLRHDIVQGALAPDHRLRLNNIAQRYDCGAIPVREALNRLSSESLVVYSQQRGFAVAPISRADLIDLTRARSMLSEVAMREAVLHGDAAWEERVLLSFHRLSKLQRYLSLSPPVPNPEFDRPHREFHSALLSGCGSRWMVDLSEKLFDHAERYRNLSRKISVIPREEEHKKIVDAALGRRVEEAVSLIKRHVELTAEIVMEGPRHQSP
jgi:GntR family transcriptional regulator, carbon starvation induced regulator